MTSGSRFKLTSKALTCSQVDRRHPGRLHQGVTRWVAYERNPPVSFARQGGCSRRRPPRTSEDARAFERPVRGSGANDHSIRESSTSAGPGVGVVALDLGSVAEDMKTRGRGRGEIDTSLCVMGWGRKGCLNRGWGGNRGARSTKKRSKGRTRERGREARSLNRDRRKQRVNRRGGGRRKKRKE